MQEFSVASVETALKQYAEQSGHKVGHVFTTVRIAVTGKMSTPPLMESLEALGAELVLQRLAETSDLLQSGGSV